MYGKTVESPSPRSNDDLNRLVPAGVFLPSYHTTYAGPRPEPTYINLHSDPPKREPVRTTREHSTPPPCSVPDGILTGWVHATPAISHAQCAVVFSHNGIAEVSGLPEYVVGTSKSRPHDGLQRTVLNRHRRDKHNQANLSA